MKLSLQNEDDTQKRQPKGERDSNNDDNKNNNNDDNNKQQTTSTMGFVRIRLVVSSLATTSLHLGRRYGFLAIISRTSSCRSNEVSEKMYCLTPASDWRIMNSPTVCFKPKWRIIGALA